MWAEHVKLSLFKIIFGYVRFVVFSSVVFAVALHSSSISVLLKGVPSFLTL